MDKLFIFLLFVGIAAGSVCKSGSQPKLTTTTLYTNTDASVLTSIAFVAQFKLDCDKNDLTTGNLYADVNSGSRLVQVARSDKGFQVSWSEDVAKASKGDYVIRILDEEQLNIARRAKSWTSPEIKSVGEFKLNHPGAYSGPWLNSEHLALLLSIVVVYMAITSKSKLLS